MEARPYQQEAIDNTWEIFKTKRSALILLATGLGKCFAKDTPIMLFDGNIIPVQNVKVGDQLMGPDSEPRTVESLAHGYEEMYKIVPVKGMPYIVNESHILSLKLTGMSKDGKKSVRDSKGNRYHAGDIANIDVKTYLASSNQFKHCAKGYRVPVNFSNGYKKLPIDPYVLGIWLGDGSSRTTNITTMDKEVVDSLSEYCISNGLRLKKRNQCGKAWTYSITCDDRRHGKNILRKGLKDLNLLQNKHIPHIYKTASISTRYELLAGILDSDGFYGGKCYDYVSVRKQFAEDIAFIARSLGLAAYIKPCKKTCTNGVTNDYYRICISGDLSLIPCRIERRKASERKQIKNVLLTGIKVSPVGVGEYFGFTLSGKDRRFLLGDFTVAHNTVTFAHAAERMWREKRKRILVIAHREELIRQAADKIERATELHCEIEMAAEYATTNTMFELPEVVVATVQTLSQDYRLKRFDPKDFSLIVVDECHRIVGASYRKVIDYFFAGNPDIKLSGVTATADRSDEQALGQVFDDVAKEYDILDGINDGWLVPLEQAVVEVGSMDLSQCKIQLGDFASNDLNGILEQEKVLQEMALPFMRIAKGRKTLVFTSSVEQSRLMCDVFNKKGFEPGSTEHIDGTTAKDIRRNIIERYYRSELTRLCNCGIFTEGFDDPGVHVIANGRPTKSRMLYTQICGRATRPAEEIASLLNDCKDADERKAMIAASSKPSALIIDPVGNSGRHKLITVADVLGGKYPDEVVELAVANAKRKGKPENVMTELARAEAEIAERHRKAELAKAREQIKFNGKFFVRYVSPFDALGIVPQRIPGYVKTNPMTSKQRDMLERWGIPNVDQIQNTLHASQIIEAAPPSSAQLYRLRQAGLPIDKINRLKANKIITIMAKNNWQLTAGNREYIMKEIINKK